MMHVRARGKQCKFWDDETKPITDSIVCMHSARALAFSETLEERMITLDTQIYCRKQAKKGNLNDEKETGGSPRTNGA